LRRDDAWERGGREENREIERWNGPNLGEMEPDGPCQWGKKNATGGGVIKGRKEGRNLRCPHQVKEREWGGMSERGCGRRMKG